MNQLQTNIYLDESRIDNPESDHMVIGGLFVARNKVRGIQRYVEEIKARHQFKGEIKWVKADKRKKLFFEELTRYLTELPSSDLAFHCIVVKKEDVDYEKYHHGDKELAFFKFIYELLKQRIRHNTKYYIFLDFKPTKTKERVKNLTEYLKKHIYFNNTNTTIKHCQAYSSKENLLIQLADLFSGAVGYHYNTSIEGTAKDDIAKMIAKNVGHGRLSFSSPKTEEKFNIFKINFNS